MLDIRSAAIFIWEEKFLSGLTVRDSFGADKQAIDLLRSKVSLIAWREAEGAYTSILKWQMGFPDESLIYFGEWVARCLVQKAILLRVKGIGEKRQASVMAAMATYKNVKGGL